MVSELKGSLILTESLPTVFTGVLIELRLRFGLEFCTPEIPFRILLPLPLEASKEVWLEAAVELIR